MCEGGGIVSSAGKIKQDDLAPTLRVGAAGQVESGPHAPRGSRRASWKLAQHEERMKDDKHHGIPPRQEALSRTVVAPTFAKDIVETARHPLLILDADLRLVSANRAFYRTFQVTPEESEGRLLYELVNNQWDIPRLRRLLNEVLLQNASVTDFEVTHDFETIGRRTMLLNASRIHHQEEAHPLILLAIEDATDRRRAEERSAYLNRVLRAIRNVNQLIIREQDRDRLLQGICDLLIETGGYHHAWIAFLDGKGRWTLAAAAGQDRDWAALRRQLAQGETVHCLRRVLAQNGVQVIHEPRSLCSGCPLAGRYNGRKGMAVLLRHGDQAPGALVVSVAADFAAGEEGQALLDEIAGDIALALHHLDTEKARQQLEEMVRQSEQFFRALTEKNPAPVLIHSEGRVSYVNSSALHLLGVQEAAEVLGKLNLDLVHPEDREAAAQRIARARAGETVGVCQQRLLRPDGSAVPVEVASTLITYRGAPAHLVVFWDVSERERAREGLRRYAEEQKALYAVTSAASSSLDPETLLEGLLDTTLPLLNSTVGWVELPGPTLDDPPRLVAHRGLDPRFIAAEEAHPLRDCPVCAPLLTGGEAQTEPMLCIQCPRLSPQIMAEANLHSHIGIPLTARGQVLGVLNIAWDAPNPYTQQDRDLLTTIGRQVGMALRNAQLYQKARQVDRLQVLNELNQALAATLDPDEMAEITLHRLAAAVDAPLGALFTLPDPETPFPARVLTLNRGWIEMKIPVQRWLERPTPWQQSLWQDLREKAFRPLRAEELGLLTQEHLPQVVPRWGEHGLLVPVLEADRPILVLALGGRQEPFTEEDRALMRAVVTHAAQFIQNAWHHQTLVQTESLLAEAQQIAHLGSWEWNVASGALRWSAEVYRIFGVSPDTFEATYENFLQTVHPDDREKVIRAVELALNEGQPYDIKHRILRPDGEER
ncbi:MAG TPA: PAS domain S-box protein, partial [Anaerolineae bacterium]|nr:PAS domain S-box protein [Anaerolineae bacterium]